MTQGAWGKTQRAQEEAQLDSTHLNWTGVVCKAGLLNTNNKVKFWTINIFISEIGDKVSWPTLITWEHFPIWCGKLTHNRSENTQFIALCILSDYHQNRSSHVDPIHVSVLICTQLWKNERGSSSLTQHRWRHYNNVMFVIRVVWVEGSHEDSGVWLKSVHYSAVPIISLVLYGSKYMSEQWKFTQLT